MERRKQAMPGAQQSTLQNLVATIALTSLVAVFIACGLDHRFGTIVMGIGIALGLGSFWTLLILMVQIPMLVIRILDEEKLLEKDLPGYREYEQKVRYRLVPYLW